MPTFRQFNHTDSCESRWGGPCECFPKLRATVAQSREWEGLGTITVFVFTDHIGQRTRKQTFENIKYDEIFVSKGILELEDKDENLFHVPNVAYYTIEGNLS